MIMKSLLLNSQLFIYGPLFLLLVNISTGKARIPIVKSHLHLAAAAKFKKQGDDCMATLKNINFDLKNDQDGILNEDEIEGYEQCLESVTPELDFKNNMHDYYFLLDCYTNLMDYYDLVVHDEEKLNEIEDSIEEISTDE